MSQSLHWITLELHVVRPRNPNPYPILGLVVHHLGRNCTIIPAIYPGMASTMVVTTCPIVLTWLTCPGGVCHHLHVFQLSRPSELEANFTGQRSAHHTSLHVCTCTFGFGRRQADALTAIITLHDRIHRYSQHNDRAASVVGYS